MQVHVLRFRPHLLDRRMTPQVREAVPRHNAVGLLPDLVATAMAAVSPYATLAITAAVAVFYAAPSTTADVVVSPPPGER